MDQGTAPDETSKAIFRTCRTGDDHQVQYLGYVEMPATYDSQNDASFARTTQAVLTDVENWRWYGPINNIKGIFFDEVERLSPDSDPEAWSSADLPQIEYVVSQMISNTPFRTIVD